MPLPHTSCPKPALPAAAVRYLWRLASALLLLSGTLLPAQENPPAEQGWQEVEDWEQDVLDAEVGPRSAPSWRRYLSGSLGLFGAVGGDNKRHAAALGLRYDYSFKKGSTVWEISAASQSVSLEQSLRRENRSSGQEYKTERTIKASDNFVELQDGYISYQLQPSLVASIGRRRITWGQFDAVSPVNLMLPLQFQTRSLELSKRNFRRPQDHLSLRWFPRDRWELQLYYFPTTRLDKLLIEILENDAANESDRIYERLPGTNSVQQEPSREPRRVADLESHDQKAARVLFYPDWGIVGFTWYRGREHLFYEEQRYLSRLEGVSKQTLAYNVRRRSDLLPLDGWGLEIAVPNGDWTWKAELYYAESFSDIYANSRLASAVGSRADELRYYETVLTENNGELFVPVDRYWLAVGADAKLGLWRLNMALLLVTEHESTSLGEDLVQLEDFIHNADDDDFNYVFPSLNITRELSGGRAQLGGALGFFGKFAGLLFFYHRDVSDSFNWQAGVEFLRQGSDELLSEVNEGVGDEDDLYELEGGLSPGLHLSLFHTF